jgi:L-alanine-DL-glutamate epimerase-like enolase superfamily enzyme
MLPSAEFPAHIKILSVTTDIYRWPREKVLRNGLHTHSTVHLAVVKIMTDAGIVGVSVTRPKPGDREIRELFGSKLIGRDPTMTSAIWAELWSPKLYGRRGPETRALSCLDFALWDIKAKLAGLPLHRLLGGHSTSLPTYIAGGYYEQDKDLKALQAEMAEYVEYGARAVKMKVGGVSINEDIARVKAVREAIGPDIRLMVDANCAYSAADAVRFGRRLEEFDIFWFEEPVQPDDYEGMRKIAAAISTPIATGENEYTKFGFRDLIATESIAVLQPDARYAGGVTEFMKIAALGEAHGLKIAPHGDQQVHLPLLAAIANPSMLEFYPARFDPMFGKIYRDSPVLNADGTVSVLDVVGLGCEPNEEALAPYRVS